MVYNFHSKANNDFVLIVAQILDVKFAEDIFQFFLYQFFILIKDQILCSYQFLEFYLISYNQQLNLLCQKTMEINISKQVIFLAVGYQATHLLFRLFQLFNIQHRIDLEGNKQQINIDKNQMFQYSTLSRVYHIQRQTKAKYILRCIFVDFYQNQIKNLMSEKEIQFFGNQNIVTIKGKQKGNFASYYCQTDKQYFQQIFDSIRKQVQKCENLEGFKLFYNTSEGFGSGNGTKIIQLIKKQFPNKIIINYAINQNIQQNQKTCKQSQNLYLNQCLSYNAIHQNSSVCLTFDNSKISSICKKHLELAEPSIQDINRLLCHHIWNITSSLRYQGCMLQTLSSYREMLVLVPNLKYIVSGYSPIIKKHTQQIVQVPIFDIFKSTFVDNLNFSNCDLNKGLYLTTNCAYQGHVIPKHTGPTIQWAKQSRALRFSQKSPTGFRCGLFYNHPVYFQDDILIKTNRSFSMLVSNTSIVEHFFKLSQSLQQNLTQKKVIQTYLEQGLEVDLFKMAQQNFTVIEDEYEQWSRQYIVPQNLQQQEF